MSFVPSVLWRCDPCMNLWWCMMFIYLWNFLNQILFLLIFVTIRLLWFTKRAQSECNYCLSSVTLYFPVSLCNPISKWQSKYHKDKLSISTERSRAPSTTKPFGQLGCHYCHRIIVWLALCPNFCHPAICMMQQNQQRGFKTGGIEMVRDRIFSSRSPLVPTTLTFITRAKQHLL